MKKILILTIMLVCAGAHAQSISQSLARDIMDKNYFGIEEAVRYLHVTPSEKELSILTEIPFSKATLESCKKTCVLVAVFPISILEMHSTYSTLFYPRLWYVQGEPFVAERGLASWQLFSQSSLPGVPWSIQKAMVTGQDKEIPSVRVITYVALEFFLATGTRAFPNFWVASSDIASNGTHVVSGHFDDEGFDIRNDWDGSSLPNVAVVTVRKSESK